MLRTWTSYSVVICITCLFMGACDSSDESGTNTSGEMMIAGEEAGESMRAGTMAGEMRTEGGMVAEPPMMMCDVNGLTPAADQLSGNNGNLTYTVITSSEAPYNSIQIQSLSDWNGPTTPGTYSLDGLNFADCGLCLLAYTNCTEDSCEKTLYAEEGELEITEIGTSDGDRFTARFKNVVFREVTIDDSTFRSTEVPDGQTWCINDVEITQEFSNPGAASCAGPGMNCIGDSIPDYTLLSCATGEMVSAHSLMDQEEKGLWMMLTAGWCSACSRTIPQVRSQEQRLAEVGVNVIYVMGEDSSYAEPDLAYCQRYASAYGEGALERFYIDFSQGRSFASTFDNLWPYTGPGGSFGLPWSGVVSSSMYNYEYIYADGAGVGDINNGINSLVGR